MLAKIRTAGVVRGCESAQGLGSLLLMTVETDRSSCLGEDHVRSEQPSSSQDTQRPIAMRLEGFRMLQAVRDRPPWGPRKPYEQPPKAPRNPLLRVQLATGTTCRDRGCSKNAHVLQYSAPAVSDDDLQDCCPGSTSSESGHQDCQCLEYSGRSTGGTVVRGTSHDMNYRLLARHSSGHYAVCSEIAVASASQPGQRIPTSEACAFPASWSGWPGLQIGGRARDHPVASPCSSPLGRSAYYAVCTQCARRTWWAGRALSLS